MNYTIELSFDLRKNKNFSEIKQLLSSLANKYKSSNYYFTHEIEGHGGVIDINDCINTVNFNDYDISNLLNYLKNIKKMKFIKIECIYSDNEGINIIYTSKKYNSNDDLFKRKGTSNAKMDFPEFNNQILNILK